MIDYSANISFSIGTAMTHEEHWKTYMAQTIGFSSHLHKVRSFSPKGKDTEWKAIIEVFFNGLTELEFHFKFNEITPEIIDGAIYYLDHLEQTVEDAIRDFKKNPSEFNKKHIKAMVNTLMNFTGIIHKFKELHPTHEMITLLPTRSLDDILRHPSWWLPDDHVVSHVYFVLHWAQNWRHQFTMAQSEEDIQQLLYNDSSFLSLLRKNDTHVLAVVEEVLYLDTILAEVWLLKNAIVSQRDDKIAFHRANLQEAELFANIAHEDSKNSYLVDIQASIRHLKLYAEYCVDPSISLKEELLAFGFSSNNTLKRFLKIHPLPSDIMLNSEEIYNISTILENMKRAPVIHDNSDCQP